MLLTSRQLEEALAYNEREYHAGRLLDHHVTLIIAAFQKAQGLQVDGKIGPATRHALDSLQPPPQAGLPTGTGMFVRSLVHTGTPDECVAFMQSHGITWLAVMAIWQNETEPSNRVNKNLHQEYGDALRAAGLGYWVWGYPWPGKESEFADALLAAADASGALGVIIDPEKPYRGTKGAGKLLVDNLMPACAERDILLGFTSYGSPWYFRDFPWGEFTDAHFAINQAYDAENRGDPAYPSKSQDAYRALGYHTLIPGLGAFAKTEAQVLDLFRNTPQPHGALIWWDWVNATKHGLWDTLMETTMPQTDP
jgi:hypothetical protein